MFAIYLSFFRKHVSFSVWHPVHVKCIQPIPLGYLGLTGNTQICVPCVCRVLIPALPQFHPQKLQCSREQSHPTGVHSTRSTCCFGDPRVPGLQRWLPHQTPQTGDFASSCPANSVSTASKTIEVWYLQVDLKERRQTNNN